MYPYFLIAFEVFWYIKIQNKGSEGFYFLAIGIDMRLDIDVHIACIGHRHEGSFNADVANLEVLVFPIIKPKSY